ncbi:hypothetical protein [Xenorhabdus japonica]|uniref:Uncharacterized protein n=1 Tax=Xenorhabdus japonica TaxID=53341 RepID=A0A1I5AXT0_9GAMM|nr:hypothetical protein [Xenorhabdus japonica]SFN67248.1 hypothetical protein SAMN05421579_11476 [Xenorhabdus japonica]
MANTDILSVPIARQFTGLFLLVDIRARTQAELILPLYPTE